MASRPNIAVYNPTSGQIEGKAIPLPAVFTAPLRQDIVQFVHTNLNKNRRQAHGVNQKAGMKHSAESWGTGRAVARIPRVSGSGTHRSGQGAFGNQCRKGRMFAPLHTWRRWHRRVNIKQKRHAVAAAIAASGVTPLVQARGHRITNVPQLPFVVSDSFQEIAKTKTAVQAFKRLGALDDVRKVLRGKKLRAGRGKLRNNRYQVKRGPLVVVESENSKLAKSLRNVQGVDVQSVHSLNLLQLAPGGQLGRFVIWTASAFKSLNNIFGTYRYAGFEKSGFHLNRAPLTNADIARIINSNEVQSAIRPARSQSNTHYRKKNALKNRQAQAWLNPNAPLQKAQARKANEDARKRRQETIEKKRQALTKDQKKVLNQRKKASKAWIHSLKKAEENANQKALGEEDDFRKLMGGHIGHTGEEADQE